MIKSVNNNNLYNFTNRQANASLNLNSEDAKKTLSAIAILECVQNGISKLSETLSKKVMAADEFTSRENVEKIAQSMQQENSLLTKTAFVDLSNVGDLKKQYHNLSNYFDIVANGKNAFFESKNHIAIAPSKNPSLILHELGHAINFEKSTFLKTLQKAKGISAICPALLVILNKFIPKKKDRNGDKKETFIEKHAGIIGFISSLPTIIEEGAASIRAIKAAKNSNLANIDLTMLKKNYACAWITYLLSGIGIGIASKIALRENSLAQKKE